MAPNLDRSGSEPAIPFSTVAPRSVTSQEAWNAPIFTIPVTAPPETVIAPETVAASTQCVAEAKALPASERFPGQAEPSPCPLPVAPSVAQAIKPEVPVQTPVEQPSAQVPNEKAPARLATAIGSAAEVSPDDSASRPAPVALPQRRATRFIRGETSEVWGLRLDRVRMDEAVDAIEGIVSERIPRYIITANLNYAMLLDRDASLQKITDAASLVLADGQPLVWRSRLSSDGHLPERVAGSELIYAIAQRAAERGWRMYFLGAEAGVAQRCADTLAELYPGLQIAGVQSPPYRSLTDSEQQQQRQSIVDSAADILLVAFGQPKGERWIHQHYQSLGIPLCIQVGASFDFVAGTAKRAPLIWRRLGLEWCHRLVSNPGRLAPRYASNAWFLFLSLIRDWRDFVDDHFGESTAGAAPRVSRES